MIFKNQQFDISKLVDDVIFLTWSWLRGWEKDFAIPFHNGHHLCPLPSPSMGRMGGFCKVSSWGSLCRFYSLTSAYGFLYVSL